MDTEASQLAASWPSPGLILKPCLMRLEGIQGPRGEGALAQAGSTLRETEGTSPILPSAQQEAPGLRGHPGPPLPCQAGYGDLSDHIACQWKDCLLISDQLGGLSAPCPLYLRRTMWPWACP